MSKCNDHTRKSAASWVPYSSSLVYSRHIIRLPLTSSPQSGKHESCKTNRLIYNLIPLPLTDLFKGLIINGSIHAKRPAKDRASIVGSVTWLVDFFSQAMVHVTPISAAAAALVLLLFSPLLLAAEQPQCSLVVSQLGPCLPYVLRSTLMPSDMCCNGVIYLGSRYSEDQEARQAICECIKSSVSPILPIDLGLINTLPQACGVAAHLPRLSFTVDCSKSVVTRRCLQFFLHFHWKSWVNKINLAIFRCAEFDEVLAGYFCDWQELKRSPPPFYQG